MSIPKHFTALAVIAGLALAMPAATHAEDYPSKNIQLIAGYPGGGLVDSINRILIENIDFDGKVVATPKPGGGGTIASAEVARAEPDGYTLLLQPTGVLMSRPIFTKLTYSKDDFVPIATVAAAITAARVGPSSPFQTWEDLAEAAKENPGNLTAATGGVGSFAHLALIMLKENYGIDILHVPFANGLEAAGAALGGHVDLNVGDNKAPELRVLGTTHSERVSFLPDTPTFTELGYDEMEWMVRFTLVAPKETPEDIIRLWEGLVEKALKKEEVITKLESLGVAPMFIGSDDLAERWDAEFKRNSKMIEGLGLAHYQN